MCVKFDFIFKKIYNTKYNYLCLELLKELKVDESSYIRFFV